MALIYYGLDSFSGGPWHIVYDDEIERRYVAIRKNTGRGYAADSTMDDGFYVEYFERNTGWHEVHDKELRRQIIMTAWPMINME